MNDIQYMQIALELAERGRGSVEPNPLVGCVIVKDDQIIGKGFHEKFGAAHAEINALADCQNNGNDPQDAVMYVTLEPCCHQGKTAPCTDAVIKSKVRKLVIASVDTEAHASGKGIKLLKEAGIEVVTGICEKQARQLNAGFFKFAETGLPWVVLKWAQSIDGNLAYKEAKKYGQWISNAASRQDANNHRRSMQGILVGVKTVIEDDPMLTVRPDTGRQPLRIVLDSNLNIPMDSKILDVKAAPTLIIATHAGKDAKAEKASEIEKKGAVVLSVRDSNSRCDLQAVLEELGKRKIQHLLVEGGAIVLAGFLESGLADAVRIYIAPKIIASKGSASISDYLKRLPTRKLTKVETREFDGDICITGLLEK